MSIDIGLRQPAKFLRNFDAQALNPQPLPPKEAGFRLFGNLESRALNPQPLPPKELGFQLFGNLNSRSLNPQPLPPKELSKLFGSPFNSRLLNPQPLPPKGEAAFAARISNPADAVALNPQPLPPKGETAFSARLSTPVDSVVTGLAKKAGRFALKIGLGPILDKIKALVKPLLDNVLQKAIGNLPESVSPAAEQLADRISGGRREGTSDSTTSNPADAVALNPQPLPPKGETAFSLRYSTPVDSVALNPQPLPPKPQPDPQPFALNLALASRSFVVR